MDIHANFVSRYWVKTSQNSHVPDHAVKLRLVHWNMLAQKLADNFDFVDKDCPMIQFDNRLRLMEQHFHQLDADVIGMSEVDGSAGEYADCYV